MMTSLRERPGAIRRDATTPNATPMACEPTSAPSASPS
jgi:hypothetical protein